MEGFRRGPEERDTNPPPEIRQLLNAYAGTLVWWRWQDDDGDYTSNATYEVHGTPTPPSEGAPIRATAARGFQFNRWLGAAQDAGEPAPPIRDYLRWGEADGGRLALDQTIQPRQIRAFAAWIWWDAVEDRAAIWESSNGDKRELVRLFAEGGGPVLPGVERTTKWHAAQEVRPEIIAAVGKITEPMMEGLPNSTEAVGLRHQTASYVFEIWDTDGKLVRLESGAGTLKTRQWQHVVVTTADATTWWPSWQIWIDGVKVAEKHDGRSIPAMILTQNYLCRSFRGCLQDVRISQEPMTPERIKGAREWSGARLNPEP
jgi:hypothetical protein